MSTLQKSSQQLIKIPKVNLEKRCSSHFFAYEKKVLATFSTERFYHLISLSVGEESDVASDSEC